MRQKNKILKVTKYFSVNLNSKDLLHWSIDASRTDYANVRYTLTSVLSKDDEVGDVLETNAGRQQSSSVRSAFLRVGNRRDVNADGISGYGFAGKKNIDGM